MIYKLKNALVIAQKQVLPCQLNNLISAPEVPEKDLQGQIPLSRPPATIEKVKAQTKLSSILPIISKNLKSAI